MAGFISNRATWGRDTPKVSREMREINVRLKHMDELGVDVQDVIPNCISFAPDHSTGNPTPPALSRSYNRWLVEERRDAKGRLRWVAVLPLLTMG